MCRRVKARRQIETLAGDGQRRAFAPVLILFIALPEAKDNADRSHAAEKFSSHAKIHLAKRRGKTLRAPPLHYILRVRPRLPNQFAWGIENSRDNHPLCLANRVLCHL